MEPFQGTRVGWWMTGALLSAALSRCEEQVGNGSAPAPPQVETTVSVCLERPTLSNAQVAEVLRVVSAGEVLAGELARQRASTPEARAHAERMVESHTVALRRLNGLLARAGLSAEPSPLSRQLQEELRQVLSLLRPLQAERFDLGYLDAQVVAHARAAFLMDAVLEPQVTDAVLATELRQARAAVQVDLEEALALQARVAPRV